MLLPFCRNLCDFPTVSQLRTVPGGSIFAFKPLRLPATSRYKSSLGELTLYCANSWSDGGWSGFWMPKRCATDWERRGSSDAVKVCATALSAGK